MYIEGCSHFTRDRGVPKKVLKQQVSPPRRRLVSLDLVKST